MSKDSGKKKGVWKLIVGIILVICAISMMADGTIGSGLICFLIGTILIIVYLWPALRPHLKAYQERELEKKDAEEERRREEEERNREWHVCNSCGAKFQGTQCPYCRTHISD